jgi:hypothetical protein
LGTDPNVLPLKTEQQREYTPKKADIPEQVKPRAWKLGQPIDPNTIYNDNYVRFRYCYSLFYFILLHHLYFSYNITIRKLLLQMPILIIFTHQNQS